MEREEGKEGMKNIRTMEALPSLKCTSTVYALASSLRVQISVKWCKWFYDWQMLWRRTAMYVACTSFLVDPPFTPFFVLEALCRS